MADKDDIDYKLAKRELHDAINQLRRAQGLKPFSDLPEVDSTSHKPDGIEYCSFCGKHKNEVRKLVAGPSVFICDECVTLAYEIIKDS